MKTEISYKFVGLLSALALAACGSSSTPAEAPTPDPVDPVAAPTETPPVPVPVPVPVPEPPTAPVVLDLMAVEMAAYESAKPVFEEQCAGCHTADAKRKKQKKGVGHFSMGSYPFDGHHRTKLGQSIRVAIGATDKAATMPQDDPGSLEGADLAALVAWADAFDAAAEAGVGYHGAAASSHGGKPKSKHKSKHKPKHKPKHKK